MNGERLKNYVGGAWVESSGEATVDVKNPATGKTLAKTPMSTGADVDRAVQAPQAAFPAWRSTSPVARARHLFKLKALLDEHKEEIGRICTWVAVGPDAEPRILTVSLRLAGLRHPSVAAERLPKALIHRNVPGEPVHAFLTALDAEWERAASVSPFGPVHRWRTALSALQAEGWPLLERSRWRLGEVTVPWSAVAPR